MPSLSVLLPVRDAARFLGAALGSLARQTFEDYEVIAVDDGSTDETPRLLARAAALDPRIRVSTTAPRGLPAALNRALERARAPLLARMDGDDLAHRRRFELQVGYLRDHPEVDVVGCRVRLFPARDTGAGMRRWADWHNALLSHEDMARDILIDSPLAHGSAVLTRRTLEGVGGWQERGWAEDLDLWIRLLDRGARFAKLPERLYGWRQHGGSSIRRDPRYRVERFTALKIEALERGLLAGARSPTLVGVGASLGRWSRALAARGHALRVVEAPKPSSLPPGAPVGPAIVVCVAARARARWRTELAARGAREGADFVFVA